MSIHPSIAIIVNYNDRIRPCFGSSIMTKQPLPFRLSSISNIIIIIISRKTSAGNVSLPLRPLFWPAAKLTIRSEYSIDRSLVLTRESLYPNFSFEIIVIRIWKYASEIRQTFPRFTHQSILAPWRPPSRTARNNVWLYTN